MYRSMRARWRSWLLWRAVKEIECVSESEGTLMLRGGGKITFPIVRELNYPELEDSSLWINTKIKDILHFDIWGELWRHLYEDIYAKHIPTNPTVIIDVGAHIGVFAILMAKRFPNSTIYCFEPDPFTRAYLERNINDNDSKNITVIPYALWNSRGTIPFYRSNNLATRSLIQEWASSTNSIEVETITIKDFLRERKITTVDFIKINAEGAELEIIEGGISADTFRGFVIAADHVRGSAITDKRVVNLLSHRGFKVKNLNSYIVRAE
jgi:FkbM family methyltransferase